MVDITFATEAKSDQLNAVDLIGETRVIRISDVIVRHAKEQPVWVYFDGDNDKPWKPSKGMLRVLKRGWGKDSDAWVDKYCSIYHEPSVVFQGKASGGIRTNQLSDIDSEGFVITLTISKHKREPFRVSRLERPVSMYPDDHFQKALPTMIRHMQEGTATLQGIIAQCQKTGQLTSEQMKQLEEGATVVVNETDA